MPIEPVDVGDAGEPAIVEGTKGEWRIDPAALGADFKGRTALLSPFDRLVYDRRRAEELFEFEYTLEMYKPAAKRRWGYFALPVLYEDRLVGKVDAAADRKASVLRVHAIHEDVSFTRTMTKAVRAELDDLASWLELDAVEAKLPRRRDSARLPGGFDDIAVGVAALDAHVVRLVPFLDDGDPVGGETATERADVIGGRKPDAEVQEAGQSDRFAGLAESEREPVSVVEHEHVVVIPPCRARVEAEVRLVETTRPLLIGDCERQMLHGCRTRT
jgi:hypothetical protein